MRTFVLGDTGESVPADSSPQEFAAAQNAVVDNGLRDRMAGHSVIEKLLSDRMRVPPRSLLARIFGADPLSAENYPWYKGALGEIAVGRVLERLGPEWIVPHAVPVGAGTAEVAGKKQRHLYNAGHEAARAAKLLSRAVGASISVTAVVVVVNPKSLTIRETPNDVLVVTDRQLLQWLTTRPTVFTQRQVQLLAAAAVRPGTWHRNPQPSAGFRNGFCCHVMS